MRNHIGCGAVSAIFAALVGCGGNAHEGVPSAPTTVTTPSTPYSAATLVPYVPLADAYSSNLTSAEPAEGVCSLAALSAPTPVRSNALTMSVPVSGPGEFAVDMVDAPNPIVTAIWVTVESVSAHVAGQGWTTLRPDTEGRIAVDLMKLKNSTTARALGFTSLDAGSVVTQIRLLLTDERADGHENDIAANYVILKDGEKRVELKVPSGFETGVKILGAWAVGSCARTTVTLDFDGEKSIWYHPNGPETEWILRPVIHAKRSTVSHIPCIETESGTVETAGASTVEPTPATAPAATTTTSAITTDYCSAYIAASGDVTDLPSGQSLVTGPTPAGGACLVSAECASGSCIGSSCSAGGAGTSCMIGPECLSGSCIDGRCGISYADQQCLLDTDCVSGLCKAGSCTTSGTGLPANASCTMPAECSSNTCYMGACLGSLPEAECSTSDDCLNGVLCVATPNRATKTCTLLMAN